jgi:hypothetical protein
VTAGQVDHLVDGGQVQGHFADRGVAARQVNREVHEVQGNVWPTQVDEMSIQPFGPA